MISVGQIHSLCGPWQAARWVWGAAGIAALAAAFLPAGAQDPNEKPAVPKCEFGKVSYDDLSTERLRLALEVKLASPRDMVLQSLAFEQVSLNGLPIFIEPYEGDVKLQKDQPIPLPRPIRIELHFREINSFDSIRELLRTSQVNFKAKILARAKLTGAAGFFTLGHSFRGDFPVDETLKIELLENPFLRPLADRVLNELSDPKSSLNVRWLEEKLQLQALLRAGSKVAPGVVLIETRYRLVDKKSNEGREMRQFGAGFLAAPQKILATKQTVEPWKFDSEAALLLAGGARLDPKGYEIIVWPAGNGPAEAQLQQALRLSRKEVSLERGPEDDYVTTQADPSASGAGLRLHRIDSPKNLATLRVRGKLPSEQPLQLEPAEQTNETLLGIQYVPPTEPTEKSQPVTAWTPARWEVSDVQFDRHFPAYAAGAPMFDARGRVRAIYVGATFALPIGNASPLIKK